MKSTTVVEYACLKCDRMVEDPATCPNCETDAYIVKRYATYGAATIAQAADAPFALFPPRAWRDGHKGTHEV